MQVPFVWFHGVVCTGRTGIPHTTVPPTTTTTYLGRSFVPNEGISGRICTTGACVCIHVVQMYLLPNASFITYINYTYIDHRSLRACLRSSGFRFRSTSKSNLLLTVGAFKTTSHIINLYTCTSTSTTMDHSTSTCM